MNDATLPPLDRDEIRRDQDRWLHYDDETSGSVGFMYRLMRAAPRLLNELEQAEQRCSAAEARAEAREADNATLRSLLLECDETLEYYDESDYEAHRELRRRILAAVNIQPGESVEMTNPRFKGIIGQVSTVTDTWCVVTFLQDGKQASAPFHFNEVRPVAAAAADDTERTT